MKHIIYIYRYSICGIYIHIYIFVVLKNKQNQGICQINPKKKT